MAKYPARSIGESVLRFVQLHIGRYCGVQVQIQMIPPLLCYASSMQIIMPSLLIQYIFISFRLLLLPTVVDFSYINQLLSQSTRDLVWYPLAQESLVGGLDGVHLVSRSWYTSCEILDTGASCQFEDVMLSADTESLTN